jgi:lipoate-protein ligase A
MHGSASRKVSGGKLVRVAVDYDETYDEVTITGDFFLQPPEALEALTAAVEGTPTDATHDELVAAIEAVDAHLIGADATDLAVALRSAVGQVDDADRQGADA